MAVADDDVKLPRTMRVLGILIILVSLTQFGIGGTVFGSIVNLHLGAFWAGVLPLTAGICGVISNNRNTVLAGSIISFFSLFIIIVGAVTDGLGYAVIHSEKACFDTDSGKVYGDKTEEPKLFSCAFDFITSAASIKSGTVASLSHNAGNDYFNTYYYNHPQYNDDEVTDDHSHRDDNYFDDFKDDDNGIGNNYNYQNNHNNNNYDGNYYSNVVGFDCVCTDGGDCFGYMLGTLPSCGNILTTYTTLLSTSTILCCIMFALCFTYTVVACTSCIVSRKERSPTVVPEEDVEMLPIEVVAAPPAVIQQPIMYMPQMEGQHMQQFAYMPVGRQTPFAVPIGNTAYLPAEFNQQQQSQQIEQIPQHYMVTYAAPPTSELN